MSCDLIQQERELATRTPLNSNWTNVNVVSTQPVVVAPMMEYQQQEGKAPMGQPMQDQQYATAQPPMPAYPQQAIVAQTPYPNQEMMKQ